MKIYIILGTILFAFLFVNCTDTSNESSNASNIKKADTRAPQTGEKLPSITIEIMQKIFEESDYADFVFYNTNFSMSMDKKASIQSTLTHISESVPPSLNPNCKAIGRVFYQIDGENYMEADIFFENGCQYYVFYVDKKKTYANMMTQDGINHYANIFQQLGSPQGQ